MKKCVVGIDEVGRGSLAGPVVVAAACVHGFPRLRHPRLGKVRDSKKLSAAQREEWLAWVEIIGDVHFIFARVSPVVIDRRNISQAANLAAERAWHRLRRDCRLAAGAAIFLDGGLYIGRRGKVSRARTIIRGDERIPAVALASIAAKVYRDRLMLRLVKKYPVYGFETHAGYGTARHYRALSTYGASRAHRLTFLRRYPKIKRVGAGV